MHAKRPFAKADAAAVAMAADYAMENCSGLPADPASTLVRVGYLRRVPDHVEPILKAAWPWAVVKWVTVIEPKRIAGSRMTHMRAGRAVVNRHVVYPLMLLKPFLEFINPSGSCHLAEIKQGLACDCSLLAVNLDAAPTVDPDF